MPVQPDKPKEVNFLTYKILAFYFTPFSTKPLGRQPV